MELSEFFPMWQQLTPAQRQQLTAAAQHRQVKAGTVLHRGSGDCLGLLLVEWGQLRVYLLSGEGREVTVYRLLPRDICLFSASCMLRSIQFDLTIEAEKDTGFWMLPPDVYQGVMAQSASLSGYTNEIMAARFSEVMWLMEQILWQRFDKRLAAFLLEESSLEGSDVLRLTHEKIANHLGTAREVVTRMLRYFQDEGMVALTRGTVTITNREKLEAL